MDQTAWLRKESLKHQSLRPIRFVLAFILFFNLSWAVFSMVAPTLATIVPVFLIFCCLYYLTQLVDQMPTQTVKSLQTFLTLYSLGLVLLSLLYLLPNLLAYFVPFVLVTPGNLLLLLGGHMGLLLIVQIGKSSLKNSGQTTITHT